VKKYRFKAKDQRGKTVTGLVQATGTKQAAAIIKERGMILIRLSKQESNIISNIQDSLMNRVGIKELATFTRQLSTMITAGLQLTNSLAILRTQAKTGMVEVISSIEADIQGGSSLADAMSKFPNVFSKSYVALIKSGETAGVLDSVMLRLADNLEKRRDFEGKVKGALIYPAVVIIGMVIVMFMMMIFVVPKLTSLYGDFQAELPLPTAILIAISGFLTKFWWLAVIAAGIFVYTFSSYSKSGIGRHKLDELRLRLPIMGNLSRMVILSDFCRTLSLMVGSGISIIDALNIVSESTGNSLYEGSLKTVSKQVEKGMPLGYVLGGDSLYPPIVSQMVLVGEETGKLDEVLSKLATYFETESEQLVKALTTVIEPLVMVVLGVGVGFLVVAIIMPIYNLTSQF
jgi:type IV pilus assembly protein PilC